MWQKIFSDLMKEKVKSLRKTLSPLLNTRHCSSPANAISTVKHQGANMMLWVCSEWQGAGSGRKDEWSKMQKGP